MRYLHEGLGIQSERRCIHELKL